MLSLILLLQLSLREVVADIPRDAGAVVTLILILVFAGFIWIGTRSPKETKGDDGK